MLAFDTNVLIYVLEDHPEFGKRARALLRDNQDGAAVSELVYAEILAASKIWEAGNKELVLEFLKSQRLKFIPLSKVVLLQAAELRAYHTPKLGLGDALHISCALQAGADVFITNDKELVKLSIPGIKISLL